MSKLLWTYDYSPSVNRYFIVDAEGFLITGPILSLETAQRVVRLHRQAVEAAANLDPLVKDL